MGAADNLKLVALLCVWVGWNCCINLYNKWLLSRTGFTFPITLTMTNKTIGWIGSLIVLFCSGGKMPPPSELAEQFKRPIVHLNGLVTALNIAFNNWSLVFISITINQLVRSLVPLPTALLSTVVDQRTYNWQVYGSMVVLIVGTCLTIMAPNAEFTVFGLIICFASVLCSASWGVLSANLMQRGGEKKLNSVSLIYVSSPTTILTLLLMSCVVEGPALAEWLQNGDAREGAVDASALTKSAGAQMAIYLLFGGCLGFSYDIIHNQFLKLTSAVTVSFAGNGKVIILDLLSAMFLEAAPTLLSIVGTVIGLLACAWYTVFKFSEGAEARKQKAEEEAAAAAKEGEKDPLIPKDTKV